MSSHNMDDLTTRVQDLPPELFSRIYELVTAVWPDLVIDINRSYRPPAILQLDRYSREGLSTQYYGGGTIFRFTAKRRKLVLSWLASVPTRFRLLIERIEVGHEQDAHGAYSRVGDLAHEAERRGLAPTGKVFWAIRGWIGEPTDGKHILKLKRRWARA